MAGAGCGGLTCSDAPAMSQQHFAYSHAPLFGRPACCKESKPLRPLAATTSVAMWQSIPPLWAIRLVWQGVCQSHLSHSCGQLHSSAMNTLLVKQAKEGQEQEFTLTA
jgi:hypothetical protein